MKQIFIVVSNNGVEMGCFSNRATAEACKKHYEYRLPDSSFQIYCDNLDLFTINDFEI